MLLRKTSSPLRAVPALAVALLLVLGAPAPALAQRIPTDQVGGVPLSAHGIAVAAAPNIQAKAGILVSGDGRVLWSRSPDTERAMASTTKMMTALVALKRGGLDRVVKVSRKATGIESGAGLVPGERLTERQLLGLMLVHSANDAAYALGEGVAGTMPAFVDMMNAEAKALGLRHTHYVNPHGLDEPGHYSSAADLATLARVVWSYPEYRRMVSLHSYSIPSAGGNGRSVFGSTDQLLGSYPGLEGGKTGYTDKAGYCFVALATRGSVSLVAVVLGTDSVDARFAQATRLLDWGFAHVGPSTLSEAGQSVAATSLAGPSVTVVTARVPQTIEVQLLDLAGPVVRRVTFDPRLAAPVFEGEPVAQVSWVQGGRTIAKAPALAAATVAGSGEGVGAVPVSDFIDVTVPAAVGATHTAPAFDPNGKVERRFTLAPAVRAPVSAGQKLGEITYSQSGKVVATVPIVAAAAVAAPTALQRLGTWWTRELHKVLGGQQMAELRVDGAWTK